MQFSEYYLTFISILYFKSSGDGSWPPLVCFTSSLSPKIVFIIEAILDCCWIPQWFSIERITGYLRGKIERIATFQYQILALSNKLCEKKEIFFEKSVSIFWNKNSLFLMVHKRCKFESRRTITFLILLVLTGYWWKHVAQWSLLHPEKEFLMWK